MIAVLATHAAEQNGYDQQDKRREDAGFGTDAATGEPSRAAEAGVE